LNIDETASKEADRKTWLWTFVTRRFTVFAVRPTREATALDDFLGDDFQGIVACDRAKLSFGTQSVRGSRFVETMLTVIETCRQHGRNAFAFTANAVQARLARQSAHTLLAGVGTVTTPLTARGGVAILRI
jgi:hypothetical protein